MAQPMGEAPLHEESQVHIPAINAGRHLNVVPDAPRTNGEWIETYSSPSSFRPELGPSIGSIMLIGERDRIVEDVEPIFLEPDQTIELH